MEQLSRFRDFTPSSPAVSSDSAFRTVFNSLPGVYLLLTPDFKIAAASEDRLKATNTTREKILGRNVFDVFPDNPNDPNANGVASLRASLEQVIATRKPHRMGLQRYDIPKSGDSKGEFEERYWSPLNSPVLNERGDLIFLIHHVEDVTDKIKAEDKMRAAEEGERRFRQIANALPQLVWSAEADGTVDWLSDWYYDYTGATRDSQWDDSQSAVHPDDLESVRERWRHSVATGENFEMEFRIRRKNDGQFRWHTGYGTALRDPLGRIIKWVGVNTDIQHHKDAARLIAIEQHKMDTIFRESTSGMALWRGPELVFERVNAAYQSLFGDRDLIGKPFRAAIPELADQPFEQILKRVFETGVSYVGHEVPARYQRSKDGQSEEGYFDLNCVQVRDCEGRPYGVYNHAVEVTERVRSRKRMEADSRGLALAVDRLEDERGMRERFVATLSHDLRTPLAAAKMSAELVLRKSNDPEAIQRLGPRVLENLRRTDEMIHDLLDANRLKSGESLSLDLRLCELNAIVIEVIDELRTIHGDRFKLNSAAPIEGYWSRDGIRRILENLCSNAIKYGRSNTPVTVTLTRGDETAEIQVHNEGDPIPTDEFPKLFKAYSRTKSAQAGVQLGWGLGLALVKGITEAHQGSVSLRSSAEEQGTTFIVKLPLAPRSTPDKA